MDRLNLNALWMWPLLATFVMLLMSFDDPFRLALAAVMFAAQGPAWRWIHSFDRSPATQKGRR